MESVNGDHAHIAPNSKCSQTSQATKLTDFTEYSPSYTSTSTQVNSHLAFSTSKIKLRRGKYPRSAIVKVGQRFLGIRELPSSSLQTAATQTGDDLLTTSNEGNLAANKDKVANQDVNACEIEKIIATGKEQRRRKQWRESKRRSRGWYEDNVTGGKQREKDEKSRKSYHATQRNRTEEERAAIRLKHQQYKKNRLRDESNNQRFWRLIKQRQFRRKGYHNLVIINQYDASIGKYGTEQPEFSDCLTPFDKKIDQYIALFFDMLRRTERGEQIVEHCDKFAERGIDLPKNFFKDFLSDQVSFEAS